MRCALVRTCCREGGGLLGSFSTESSVPVRICSVCGLPYPLDAAAENSGTRMSGGRAWQFPHFPISSFPCDLEYTPRPAPGPGRRSPRPVGQARATGKSNSYASCRICGWRLAKATGMFKYTRKDRQWLSTLESGGAGGGVAFRGAGCHTAAGGNRIRHPGVGPS